MKRQSMRLSIFLVVFGAIFLFIFKLGTANQRGDPDSRDQQRKAASLQSTTSTQEVIGAQMARALSQEGRSNQSTHPRKLVADKTFLSPAQAGDLPITVVQEPEGTDLSTLEAVANEELRVSWSAHSVAPRFIVGRISTGLGRSEIQQHPLAAASSFLKRHKKALGLSAIDSEFRLTKTREKGTQIHVHLQQYLEGVEVYGGQIAVHFDGSDVTAINGTLATKVSIDLSPGFPKSDALAAAYTLTGASVQLEPIRLVVLSPDVDPMFESTDLAWLALVVNLSTHKTSQVLIDAADGRIIRSISLDPSAINRNIWDYENTGAPVTQVVTNNTYASGSHHGDVTLAYASMFLVYNYWLYGPPDRLSYDGTDADINVGIRWRPGANARWVESLKRLEFTEGMVVTDIAGHEFTHGVMNEEGILEYLNQSGALNESYADMFGIMVDQEDFFLGEDSVAAAQVGGPPRDISQPWASAQRPQPWHVSDYQCLHSFTDRGGVHINSGIPNYVGYLIISDIGHDQAAAIFYLTMEVYLTKFSNFADARDASYAAAVALFGSSSAQAAAVQEAYTTVGLPPGASAPSCGSGNRGCFLSDAPIEPPGDPDGGSSGGGGGGYGGGGGGHCTIMCDEEPFSFNDSYLATAVDVRDDVLPNTALGQHYLNLYYTHSDRVTELLSTDAGLLVDATSIIVEAAAGFAYSSDPSANPQVLLTSDFLNRLKAFGEDLAALDGGGALTSDLITEINATNWSAIQGMQFEQGLAYLDYIRGL